MKEQSGNILILGGGISACWTFNVLRSLGYPAILISKGKLGGEQTLASQGMIHGGQRYSLQGALHKHTMGISEMPEFWDRCFKGENIPDLSQVKLLADKQYLWSAGGFASSVTAFFASKAMNTKVNSISSAEYPQIFKDPKFKGQVYQLPEVVVDALSLIKNLVLPYADSVIVGEDIRLNTENDIVVSVEVDDSIRFDNPAFVVSASGKGNEELAEKLFPKQKLTQRRPLKQILVKELEFPLYAHCITTDPRPRVTISAHPLNSNSASEAKYVWYLGGLVGVYGVDKSDDSAIQFALKEMTTLFPWINWKEKQWSALSIDRAEPYAMTGFLPDGPSTKNFSNGLLAWPTKLTFAPAIAELVVKQLTVNNINPDEEVKKSSSNTKLNTADLQFGEYPWDHIEWKNL